MWQAGGQGPSRPFGYSIHGFLPLSCASSCHASQGYGRSRSPVSRSVRVRSLACAVPLRVALSLFARRPSLTALPYVRLTSLFCSPLACSVRTVPIHYVSALSCFRSPSVPLRVFHFPHPGIPHSFSFHSSWVCLTVPGCPCLVLGWGRGRDLHLLKLKVFHHRLVNPVGVGSALLRSNVLCV
jgi:hypothetical protein